MGGKCVVFFFVMKLRSLLSIFRFAFCTTRFRNWCCGVPCVTRMTQGTNLNFTFSQFRKQFLSKTKRAWLGGNVTNVNIKVESVPFIFVTMNSTASTVGNRFRARSSALAPTARK